MGRSRGTHMMAAMALLVVLALSYATMAVAAVAGTMGAFLVAAAVSYAANVAMDWRSPLASTLLRRHLQIGHGVQFSFRQVLVLVLATRLDQPLLALGWLACSYVALHALRSAFSAMWATSERRRRQPLAWRNLDLPQLELPPPPLPWLTAHGVRRIAYFDILPLVGLAAVAYGATVHVLGALCVLAVLLAALLVAVTVADRIRLVGRPSDEKVRRAIYQAVEALAPRVAAYFPLPVGNEYMLNVWLPTLEQLTEPIVIYLRERSVLPLIAATDLPIVVLPASADVEYFHLPTVKAALYPTNATKNNHFIRLTGIKDVFIGHGDSDKGPSFNPLSRIYDEIWVAGRAGRERYRLADVGVRDEQIREIGRPQLVDIQRRTQRAESSSRPTILYAPTWEGNDRTMEYSSLARMGPVIVRTLLAMDPPVRVLFKPHPTTGRKLRSYADAGAAVSELVRSARGGHEVIDGTEGLYEAFNRADVLLSDISSVITDFLASGKPYIVTNPRGAEAAEFRRAFPSAGGAYLLGPDGTGLAEFVRDALGPDSLAARRTAVATYLLGDIDVDPLQRFNDAVAAVVGWQLADDAATGYAPGWHATAGHSRPFPG